MRRLFDSILCRLGSGGRGRLAYRMLAGALIPRERLKRDF